MKKNWILKAAAIVMASGLLVGCGSSNSSVGTSNVGTTVGTSTGETTAATQTAAVESGSKDANPDAEANPDGNLLDQILEKGVITIGTEGTYSPTVTMMKAAGW